MSCTPIKLVFGDLVRRGSVSLISGTLIKGQVHWLAAEHRSRYCEFDADAPVVLECSLGGGAELDTFVLNQHNLPDLANVSVELLDAGGTVLTSKKLGPTADTGQLPIGTVWRCGIDPYNPLPPGAKPYADTVYVPLPLTNASKVRLTISNAASGQPLKLGLLFAGKSLPLNDQFDYGNTLTPLVHGAVARLASGFGVRDKLNRKAKAWNLSLGDMGDADRKTIYNAEVEYANEPVFVSGFPGGLDYEQDNYAFVGLIEQPLVYARASYKQHTTQLTLIEV